MKITAMKKIVPLLFMLVVFVGFGYLATLPVKGQVEPECETTTSYYSTTTTCTCTSTWTVTHTSTCTSTIASDMIGPDCVTTTYPCTHTEVKTTTYPCACTSPADARVAESGFSADSGLSNIMMFVVMASTVVVGSKLVKDYL